MFLHYLKMAIRSLGKYRMQNIISIVSLAVALFCFSINMYLSRFMIQIDNWLDDRVVYLVSPDGNNYVDLDLAKEIAEQRPEIDALARFRSYSHLWKKAEDKSNVANTDYFIHTDISLLDVLGLKLISGNWQLVSNTNAEHSAVLAESFARKQYGSADAAVGQEICLDELGSVTVQAVVQDLPFANSIMNFEYSAGWLFSKDDQFIKGHRGQAFVKIKEGIDPETFCNTPYSLWLDDERAISSDSYWNLKDKDINIGGGIKFTTRSPGKTGKSDMGFWKLSLRIFLISLPGILILIVALFNYFHLLVNSILSNRREYALRRVHGACTADMWQMVSTQIIVVTILTGILSLIIARYVTPMIRVADSQGPGVTEFFIDTNVIIKHILQYIGLLVAAGLLIAWIAVTRVRHSDISDTIKRRYIGRNLMLGVQLTVAQLMITLLVAMFLKMRSNLTEPYSWLSKEDKTCIITDMIRYSDRDKMEPEISYLKSLPYITHAVCMFDEHLRGTMLTTEIDTLGYSDENSCYRVFIDSEMMDMLDVRIRDGYMPKRSTEILVDDLFSERFGLDIGDTLRVKDYLMHYPDAGYVYSGAESGWIPLIIVGHIDNLLDKSTINSGYVGSHRPSIYCNWKNLSGNVVIRCLPGYQKEARMAIAKYHNPDCSDEDIDYYGTMSLYDFMDQSNVIWNSIGFIAWTVAIIAFIITLLGVYSAISIDTSRRRKEMALRKINGAKTSQITMQFANLYIKLFIISSVISIPLSAFIIKQAILNGQPLEKGTGYAILFYLFILAVMVVFVSLTIGIKIFGIARENPADVIKSE